MYLRIFNKQKNMAKIKEIKKVKYGNHYLECMEVDKDHIHLLMNALGNGWYVE
jgi:hypothetical protein